MESRNVGKPMAAIPEEMALAVDNLRFFAGAARVPAAQAAGEYMAGLHLAVPARVDRRHRVDRALELPAHDGDLEDRSGPGGRQHRRPQAL